MGLKQTIIHPFVKKLQWWMQEVELQQGPPQADLDNTYTFLRYGFWNLMQDEVARRKPMYGWGVLQAAALAHVLKVPRISVLEFGVAGGNGLIAMERIAELAEKMTGVQIEVHGFDSGKGLPKPHDYRDQPNMWFEGQLPMDRVKLQSKLKRAELHIGWVKDTVSKWLLTEPAPIGFVSFDLDLYSATVEAFEVLRVGHERVLPRVSCYFDDIIGHTYSSYTGERLAIDEFNALSPARKLDPIHGLRHYIPKLFREEMWETQYLCHFFDHPLYNALDSVKKAVITDETGKDVRVAVSSDWKRQILPE